MEGGCMLLQAYHTTTYLPLMQKPYRANRALAPHHGNNSTSSQPTKQHRTSGTVSSRNISISVAPAVRVSIDFASARWQSLIQDKLNGEEVFSRHQLEMCVFSYVMRHLRSGSVCTWQVRAFADYRTQLPWEECQPLLDSCGVVPVFENVR